MEIEIEKLTLHHIDIGSNHVEPINLDFKEENIINYTESLIEEIIESPNKRKYKFRDGKTQVKSSIYDLIAKDSNLEEILKNNAKRLLDNEKEVDKKLRNKNLNVRVQKGSLIQIHFRQNKNDNVLICKVEHDEIINERSFDLNRGLNTKKRVFKAFLVFLENENRHQEIYLNDKNNSKYWWSGFLELEHVFTDEENTSKSLEKFIKIIDRERNNREFALDSTLIRNSLIGYYKSNKNFNFTEVHDIILKYTPFNKKFPLERIRDKFERLKSDNKFDNQFEIIQKQIDKRIVTNIPLGKGLHLKIDKYVTNLTELIKPYEDDEGHLGITILTDEAYKYIKIINEK
ncbi:hypothetical protein [Tenacibaculum xiamenense]|uniref:hypothetical protein n=1 Tax=Tenacibaculum xiamenense TaxID=1261553 RepID=UPI0038964F41